jgi:hypothetical protein
MNKKVFAGTVNRKYIIIRMGWFSFGSYHTRANHYSEYRLGIFLIKVHR